jgi:hypothetical protein
LEDDLDDVGIEKIFRRFERPSERGHLQARVFAEGLGDFPYHLRRHEQLVALHVDHDAGGEILRGLGDALGSRFVVRGREKGLSSERLDNIQDARVVRGDEDFALPPLGEAFPHAADEGLSRDGDKGFPWQALRAVARGNDDGHFLGGHKQA